MLFLSTMSYAGAKPDVILTSKNTVVLNDVVSWGTMTKLSLDLMLTSSKLGKDEVIYLVINSPGGSVSAGSLFIEILKHIPQPVHSITIFGASMGFHIAQASDARLILETGTLMSHRATLGGLSGQLDGELESRIGYYKAMTGVLDKYAASRMGLSLKEYKGRIINEMWHIGSDAVKLRSADRVASVTCSKELLGSTYVKNILAPFGPIPMRFSSCPLIVAPVSSVKARRRVSSKKLASQKAYISLLFSNKEAFITKYINTGFFSK